MLLTKARSGAGPLGETVRPPLGVQYLSASLHANVAGPVAVDFLDLRLPGANYGEVAAFARERNVGLVGISALSVEAGSAAELARTLKRELPQVPVVIGGPHATSIGESVLEHIGADFAVLGEGEDPLGGLVALLSSKRRGRSIQDGLGAIPSLVFRAPNCEIVANPIAPFLGDLDRLPFPDRSLVDESRYRRDVGGAYIGEVFTPVLTSRGCPYECTYCHRIDGKSFRARSAEDVLDELTELAGSGRRRIGIVDDIFNLDGERARTICRGIIERGLRLEIKFGNGMRADLLTDDLVDLLARAGTVRVCVPIETGSKRMMRHIRKHLRHERALNAVRRFRRHGVPTEGMFMIGFPNEKPSEIEETIRFACESELDMATFFKVVPQPGTALYGEATALDSSWAVRLRSGRYWYHSERSFYQDLTGFDLHTAWKEAWWRFYDPARIERLVLRGGPDSERWRHLALKSARYHERRRRSIVGCGGSLSAASLPSLILEAGP